MAERRLDPREGQTGSFGDVRFARKRKCSAPALSERRHRDLALPRPVAAPGARGVAAKVGEVLSVRIIRVSRIDETSPAPAQHFFHLLDRFVDDATRPARLKLVL
jgi:hypothetical protein